MFNRSAVAELPAEEYIAYHIRDIAIKKIMKQWADSVKKDNESMALTKEQKAQLNKIMTYRNRAIKQGVDFTLTEKDFFDLLAMECFYCGEAGGTLDRIKGANGYTLSNVRPCCNRCNVMKWTCDTEDFFNHIRKIYNKHQLNDDRY